MSHFYSSLSSLDLFISVCFLVKQKSERDVNRVKRKNIMQRGWEKMGTEEKFKDI
jgi:hypothetical protein